MRYLTSARTRSIDALCLHNIKVSDYAEEHEELKTALTSGMAARQISKCNQEPRRSHFYSFGFDTVVIYDRRVRVRCQCRSNRNDVIFR
jgi:hypothetical protein